MEFSLKDWDKEKMMTNQDMSIFARTIMEQKYAHLKHDGQKEAWPEIANRVVKNIFKNIDVPKDIIQKTENAIIERKFLPGGRYLFAAGNTFHQTQNCALFRAEDSREGWAELLHKISMALMSGAGIGVVYSDIRAEGKLIRRTGGTATGPLALMQMVNECGRGIMNGGNRRAAIWAGLKWDHPDIHKFITMKNWSDEIKSLKEKDYNFPAIMDMTNISVSLNSEFFDAFNNETHKKHSLAQSVYWATIKQMLKTSEPGFSIDCNENEGEDLRNACTEITSKDDSDICNLGSLNLARISSLEEMKELTELATIFLLAGTLYSDVPTAKIDMVRTKNRRLGLGLMGIHEFLLMRGKKYGPDDELEKYLKIYETSTEISHKWADKWEISKPIKTRAIAPTGTIGIIAETTTGIEPIFCVAYKRRYLKHKTWNYQYVIDPTAKKLIDNGINPELMVR
jgi:ribonucleoside-diphosphate reductase alpha chain